MGKNKKSGGNHNNKPKGPGGNKQKSAKSPFAVASAKNKKKPKEVKSNLKKIKAHVKVQQEKSDEKLKALHQSMVVKQPAPMKKKVNKRKKAAKVTTAVTNAAQKTFSKMQVD